MTVLTSTMESKSGLSAKGNICGKIMSARMLMAILGSSGMGIAYGLKVNLSVAIVSMVNNSHFANLPKNNETDLGCHLPESITASHEDGPFEWSSTLQGTILGSYFWGYMLSVFPGGRLSEIFSAKWVMFFSIFVNIICTLLSPIMAKIHVATFIAMRVGNGLAGGVTFPAMNTMISKWVPPCERSFISGIIFAGTSLGTVNKPYSLDLDMVAFSSNWCLKLTSWWVIIIRLIRDFLILAIDSRLFMLFSGLIAQNAGWEAVFYVEGGVSVIWCILWAWLIRDDPNEQQYISEEERAYILASLNVTGTLKKKKAKSLPWRAILTSIPFWALLVSHFCNNWNFYLVLLNLPLYFRHILKMDIQQNAVASSLPYFTQWIFCVVLGKVLDYFRANKGLSTTSARRIAMSFASVIPMVCFIILCFFGCDRLLATILLGIIVTSLGAMFCSILCNHVDLSPNFAGSLMGLTNAPASIGGIVVPIIVGKVTENNPSIKSWQTIFYITIGIYLVLFVVFSTLTSGEEQPWNKIEEEEEEEKSETEYIKN